ncbi:MAG: CapA family protein [Bacilli bacterium]|nr:CapA family protein [Bacilli bacterium]
MKKRKVKKSVYVIFLIILILTVGTVTILKNQSQKNVEKSKPEVNEKTDKVVEEEPKNKKMSLIAVGDVLIHESVYKDAYQTDGTYNFHHMFTEIEPIIKKYDLKFCNQESTIGGSTLGISGYPSFNSPDEIGDEIVNLGFNLISLANNHVMDRGENAVLYSNSYWKTKNVITAGSYSSMEERNQVNVYEQNGIKYAFLAYTTSLNGGNPSKEYYVNMYSADKVKTDIEAVKNSVDVIIVSMHWGVEYTNTPTESQQQIAEYLSSLGVNLVIGHHPHVVQPVTYVNDTLVIYSLGNFISNQLSIGLNQGIGLMVGMDIVVEDGKVTFENLYKELILSYAFQSTNFKVMPFSKLNNDLLNDYESVKTKYMNIVEGV